MLTVRCDSCGEIIERAKAFRAQFWPFPEDSSATFRAGEVCQSCVNDFMSGKMHSDATIDHSKL